MLTSGGGISNLDDLDRIDGEELLLRDLEASAGALLSASAASSSNAQIGQVNASGQGIASPGMSQTKNSRNSATRVSINKTAQRRAQVLRYTAISPF